jgi:energy-converting hydrogenase Eha subunit G
MIKKNIHIHTVPHTGFTVIETVIYIAIFTIFIGGAVVSAFNLIMSNDTNKTDAYMEEEGQFVLAKIEWMLSQSMDPFLVGDDTPLTLTHLLLTHEIVGAVAYTNISFTLQTHTPTGRLVSQDFSGIYFPK